MVSIPLKNISQLGLLFPIYGKIKIDPNHQPGYVYVYVFLVYEFLWVGNMLRTTCNVRCVYIYMYIFGHYLLIYLFIHVVFHVFCACLKFVCIPVVPGPRRGGSFKQNKTTIGRRWPIGKFVRCRSDDILKLSGASTNEQLVVEMPIKGHERNHAQLNERIKEPMNR